MMGRPPDLKFKVFVRSHKSDDGTTNHAKQEISSPTFLTPRDFLLQYFRCFRQSLFACNVSTLALCLIVVIRVSMVLGVVQSFPSLSYVCHASVGILHQVFALIRTGAFKFSFSLKIFPAPPTNRRGHSILDESIVIGVVCV